MIRCNHCGTNNLDGSEYCDECGTKLTSAEEPSPRQPHAPPAQFITQVAPPPPPSFTKDNATPKPATPYMSPPPSHPSSGQSPPRELARELARDPVGDHARSPSHGADQVKDKSQKRTADSVPRQITNPAAPPVVLPPVAAPAANFPAPPNVTEAEAPGTQSGPSGPGGGQAGRG